MSAARSLTLIGSSSVSERGALALALRRRGCDVSARGIVGASVSRWVREPITISANQDAVLVYLGGNDARVDAGDIRAVDARIRARTSAPVYWLALPTYPRSSAAHGRDVRMRIASRESGVMALAAVPPTSPFARDGVHFTRQGADRYVSRILTALDRQRKAAMGARDIGSLALFCGLMLLAGE